MLQAALLMRDCQNYLHYNNNEGTKIMANTVVVTGRLTADPEIRQTPKGDSVTTIGIAVPRKFSKDKTDFFDVVAWRKTAEFIGQYFAKGKWIEINGSIQSRVFTDKNGVKRKAVEIVADDAGFVGDKVKGDNSSPAPPPIGVDPFAQPPSVAPAQAAPTYAAPSYSTEFSDFDVDDDGDLPF